MRMRLCACIQRQVTQSPARGIGQADLYLCHKTTRRRSFQFNRTQQQLASIGLQIQTTNRISVTYYEDMGSAVVTCALSHSACCTVYRFGRCPDTVNTETALLIRPCNVARCLHGTVPFQDFALGGRVTGLESPEERPTTRLLGLKP